jgi:hypothetical protein
MTSAPNYAGTLEKFRARNGDGLGKGREVKGLFIKPKEDLQLLKRQISSQPAFQEEQLDHQRELEQVPGGWNRDRQGPETTTWSNLTEKTTIASNIVVDLSQMLRNTKARSITGNFGKRYAMLKVNPNGQTFRAFKHSLTTQWDILPKYQSMIKEYYKVKESQKGQFEGDRMSYHVWQRRFIYIVHSQPPAEPLESVKTFIMVEDQNVICTDNKEAEHRVKLRNSCDFSVHKEKILSVTCHMLTGGQEIQGE